MNSIWFEVTGVVRFVDHVTLVAVPDYLDGLAIVWGCFFGCVPHFIQSEARCHMFPAVQWSGEAGRLGTFSDGLGQCKGQQLEVECERCERVFLQNQHDEWLNSLRSFRFARPLW